MEGAETEIVLAPGTSHLVDTLRSSVQKVLLGSNGYASVKGLVRVVVPLAATDPLRWLSAQPSGPRFYWQGRGRDAWRTAVLGVADEIRAEALSDVPTLLDQKEVLLGMGADDARYFGGCAFDFQRPQDATWTTFPPVWFFLPRFELNGDSEGSRLVCNLVLPRDRARAAEILDEIDRLAPPCAGAFPALPLPDSRENVPEKDVWARGVNETLDLLSKGDVGKVVLARKAAFAFPENLDPYALLERLSSVTPACFHFLVAQDERTVFAGASPERLFRREGRLIDSEAVAGTRPRGTSVHDDERLHEELLLSKKDRLEHVYVEETIRRVLNRLCERVDTDASPSAMTLARGRHLYSRIHGELREGVTDLDVLQGLHPTPAVGGQPTEEALEVIRRCEPFSRGWYAGPVGWMSRDSSEFAVAIRTGLLSGNRLTLFSGAGIVNGSRPDAEWDEIEHKIGDFTNVLGLDVERAKY